VLFDRGWRGTALKDFDICGNRDGLNVFEVLIAGAFSPVQELLDCPVVGGSSVRVADRDGKKFEELFSGLWTGVALYLNRRLRSQVIHDLNTVNYCT
jgi:hypothetical protein